MINEQYLTVDDLAKKFSVKRETIYRMCKRGVLKPIRFGKSIRFSATDIEEYVNRSKGNTSTARMLLKHAGTWVGGKEDAERCLKYILANRTNAEF